MTGLDGKRVYLDWNATAPLRAEARAAMLRAMDAVGNPSSVHAEGRDARAMVERARGQVAALLSTDREQIIFTSGATEAAHRVLFGDWPAIFAAAVEHDAVYGAAVAQPCFKALPTDGHGQVDVIGIERWPERSCETGLLCLQGANSETGVLQSTASAGLSAGDHGVTLLADQTQSIGKIEAPYTAPSRAPDFWFGSAHKLGGPTGVGVLVTEPGASPPVTTHGGGQEQGRRSGTENVVGIAGFGAAAEAARRDIEDGLWDRVAQLRNILESAIEDVAPDVIFAGRAASRLPNTTCFAVPGWRGETQVMQLDLAGFAVSAGSACSSGKVRESRVLRAMGWDAEAASSAIRVSLGPTTTEAEILAFATAWARHYGKRRAREAQRAPA
ncbi:MAG: cysteine desulfurase family protein [Pseudomonadota bacterium]